MSFTVFINFNGNCREALEFYSKVFQQDIHQLMTYDQMPPDPTYTVPEEDKNLIMYAGMQIFGAEVMFSDTPSAMPFVQGQGISPTLGSKDKAELRRVFEALCEGGTIDMPLGETFWSELYGMVTDKFGIPWQVSHESGRY